MCSRQPRPSGGMSAHWAPGLTGGASRGEGGAWRQALGWLTSAPLCLRVENPELEASTPRPLDRSGQAGRCWLEEGLPGSLDREVGHDMSTLRVSAWGNKHSLPGCPPGTGALGTAPSTVTWPASQDLVQPACG